MWSLRYDLRLQSTLFFIILPVSGGLAFEAVCLLVFILGLQVMKRLYINYYVQRYAVIKLIFVQ